MKPIPPLPPGCDSWLVIATDGTLMASMRSDGIWWPVIGWMIAWVASRCEVAWLKEAERRKKSNAHGLQSAIDVCYDHARAWRAWGEEK